MEQEIKFFRHIKFSPESVVWKDSSILSRLQKLSSDCFLVDGSELYEVAVFYDFYVLCWRIKNGKRLYRSCFSYLGMVPLAGQIGFYATSKGTYINRKEAERELKLLGRSLIKSVEPLLAQSINATAINPHRTVATTVEKQAMAIGNSDQ